MDKNAPPDAQEKNFIIRGTPDAVERAKAMILEKLGLPGGPGSTGYGGGGSSGGYGGSWGGQYQAPANYQPDAGGKNHNFIDTESPKSGCPNFRQ